MVDTDKLARQLQGLPAEIFNHIFALTIQADSEIFIDYTYEPPVGLQLSRKTRESFANDYYANTTFRAETTNGQDRVRRWLTALPVAHVNLLRTVEMDVLRGSGIDFSTDSLLTWFVRSEYKNTRGLILGRPGVVSADFLKVDFLMGEDQMWST